MSNTFFNKTPKDICNSLIDNPLDLKLLAYLGHLAPSVHNIQPWELALNAKENTLVIGLSDKRKLDHSDPAQRQTWISIGAFIQNILSVSENLPISVLVQLHENTVKLKFEKKSRKISKNILLSIISAILQRQTNRSSYSIKDISKAKLKKLDLSLEHSKTVDTIVVSDRRIIEQIAKLIKSAARLAFSGKDLRAELVDNINAPYSSKLTGIPAESLTRSSVGKFFERTKSRLGGFSTTNANQESTRIYNSAAVFLVFTSGDTVKDWFKAGQEYEKLCLKTTEIGLAHSTMAALVEAPDYHKEVEKLVNKKMRLQVMVRTGFAPDMKHRSKRLPLDQVLHIIDDSP